MARVLAAADIGSNTAHLLVALAGRKRFRRIVNESEWLSLGEVVSREGEIPLELADRLVATLIEFTSTTERLKAESFYVFATEAMRRAANHEEVLERIRVATGVTVDLIAPRREAELGVRGAMLDADPGTDEWVAETGGGSVQLAEWVGGEVGSEWSLPLGTGAMIARAGLTQPATAEQVERLRWLVDEALSELPAGPKHGRLVACGGVARGIWRALHPDGERTLEWNELDYLAWDAARLDIGQIAARYGVKPKRAATLLPGATVYRKVLEQLGLNQMTVSVFGVREGAVVEMLDGRLVR